MTLLAGEKAVGASRACGCGCMPQRRSEPQGRADPLRMLQHTLFRGRSRSLTSMSMASALPASIDEEVSGE